MLKRNWLKFTSQYWKTIVWFVFICYALFSSNDNLPHPKLFSFSHFDKVVHFGLFFILQWIVTYDYYAESSAKARRKNILIILVGIWLYAVSTELLQLYFFTGRDGDIMDLLADTVGMITAALTFNITKPVINRFFHRKQ